MQEVVAGKVVAVLVAPRLDLTAGTLASVVALQLNLTAGTPVLAEAVPEVGAAI